LRPTLKKFALNALRIKLAVWKQPGALKMLPFAHYIEADSKKIAHAKA
jgi:hypothetical protein